MVDRSDGTLLFDTKLDAGGLKTGLGGIGSIAGKALAGVTALTGAGVAGFAALSKSALDAVGDYEQLVGGVETLFGAGGLSIEEYADSVGKSVDEVSGEYRDLISAQNAVLKNADEAYRNAGMSANEYMETVTSFSASMIQSLEGDTYEAAKKADMAITDMADNANKMGTPIESLQTAYAGFAKQNYTMLDNLKLGYGGTKEEMERLLEDAEKFSGIEYDISSYADVVDAIHVVQTEMGITGTTAKEASTTIQGSMSSAKAAWTNFLAGSGDVGQLVDAVNTAAGVIVENLGEIIPRLAEGLPDLLSQLGDMIPGLIDQLVPPVVDGATALISGLIEVLPELIESLLPAILTGAMTLIESLVESMPDILAALGSMVPIIAQTIMDALPLLLDVGMQIILMLAQGITESLPQLIPQIVDLVLQIAQALLSNLPLLIDAAIQIFMALVQGMIEAIPQIIAALPQLITSIIEALTSAIPQLVEAGVELFISLIENLPFIIEEIVKAAPQIIEALVKGFLELGFQLVELGAKLIVKLKDGFTQQLSNLVAAAKDIGKNLVNGLWNGIESGWSWLKDKVGELASSLFDSAKKALGISSPSKKFRYLGEMCVAGWDEGIADLMAGDAFGAAVNNSIRTVSLNTGTGETPAGSSQTFNFYDTQTSPDAIRRNVQNTMTFGLAGGI